MVGRTALPRFDVGTDSGAGYGDQFFTTWPSEEEVWQMTAAGPSASSEGSQRHHELSAENYGTQNR